MEYAPLGHFETLDADHGRIEIRRYATTGDIAWLQADDPWAGIKSITMAADSAGPMVQYPMTNPSWKQMLEIRENQRDLRIEK